MTILDLSTAIEMGLASDKPHQAPQIIYRSHADNAETVAKAYGVTKDELPYGIGWANETITLASHSGCHMDAPWHYFPTMNNGEPSRTIDQVPFEYCFSDGVHLDFSQWDPRKIIHADDIRRVLDQMEYQLKPLDIVLLESGAAPHFGQPDYTSYGAGVSEEATVWLMEQGIKVVGTDSFTWDMPFALAAEQYREKRDNRMIWEGHFAGRRGEYYQMEKLTNLDQLPGYGFKVICFPVKLKGASAGWTRAVALLDQ